MFREITGRYEGGKWLASIEGVKKIAEELGS